MEEFHDIYDRVVKRCLSLSSKSTIHLINGLYDTGYPDDSQVTYHWTEHEDDDLRRTLADTIITVNGQCSYHIEIQMTKEGDIIWRMFDYGYHAAVRNLDASGMLRFPEPRIIYLYEHERAPDVYQLTIDFGSQGTFLYQVSTFKYLDKSLEELNRKKLIVLIPFQLLRLRKAIEKERTLENLDALKNLITHDIIGSITENERAGNITKSETRKLKRMTLQLYHHIYDKYGEMEEAGVNSMVEEALILDIDIIEQEHKKELAAKEKELAAKEKEVEAKEKEVETKEHEIMAMKLLLKGVPEAEILSRTGLTRLQLERLKQ